MYDCLRRFRGGGTSPNSSGRKTVHVYGLTPRNQERRMVRTKIGNISTVNILPNSAPTPGGGEEF